MALLQVPLPVAWGREGLEVIRRDFYLPKSKLYAERPDKKQPAFNWDVGVMISALNAAARYDSKYKIWLREYANASRVYWNKGGYDVLPGPKPFDRYYDDNAWMALALAETYEVLGDKKYLRWAREALDFALSGEAKDGGIYWREKERSSRNTCACAPTAAACLAIYRITHDIALLNKAQAIYQWTIEHLQDPADGLFWDALSNSGQIESTKWSYNTALMIRTAVDLQEQDRLKKMLTSSRSRWLKNGKLDDVGRFAHLLLEAWVRADGVKEDYINSLSQVQKNRSAKGYYPSHWSKQEVAQNPELLDQASFVRACFLLGNAAGKPHLRMRP